MGASSCTSCKVGEGGLRVRPAVMGWPERRCSWTVLCVCGCCVTPTPHQTCFQTALSQPAQTQSHACQPLFSFPANLKGGTAASKISLPPPFPIPGSSLLCCPLSFWRIKFCSSQLQPFDVHNDEAVEIGIDTSEDRGGRPPGT